MDSSSAATDGTDDSGQQQTTPTTKGGEPQAGSPPPPAKRLFFIIPNFRSVNTTTVLPPQTLRQKFSDASKDTFDYSALVLELLLAAYNYGLNATPEFGSGGLGYSRYLWHSAADQSIENYMVEFVVPALTREDTRYYQLGHGGFKKRTWYALTRTFVTKSDDHKATANLGELVGAAGGAAISQQYYPRPERTFDKWAGQYGTNLLIDAASYFLREFEPEITRVMSHQKAAPATP